MREEYKNLVMETYNKVNEIYGIEHVREVARSNTDFLLSAIYGYFIEKWLEVVKDNVDKIDNISKKLPNPTFSLSFYFEWLDPFQTIDPNDYLNASNKLNNNLYRLISKRSLDDQIQKISLFNPDSMEPVYVYEIVSELKQDGFIIGDALVIGENKVEITFDNLSNLFDKVRYEKSLKRVLK